MFCYAIYLFFLKRWMKISMDRVKGDVLSRITREYNAKRWLAVTAPPLLSCQMTAAHMSRGAAGGAGFPWILPLT